MPEIIEKQLKTLPLSPGVYFFKDGKGVILYIGKANKLRSRVRSYFRGAAELSDAKKIMVKRIASIETTITSNEQEALILESIMVKRHKPHFNVSLKDDKSYNFIKIDYRYPRPVVTTVRRPEFDAGRSRAKYFGPYTSGGTLYENLRILRRIFPYRKKPKEPTVFEQELMKKRSLGPIPQTDEEYKDMIARLARVVEGDTDDVIRDLKTRMQTLAANKQYETAAAVRDQIKNLELIQSRQKIMSVRGGSQDVISIFKKDDSAAVNVFVIRGGKLINKLNFLLQHAAGETMTQLVGAFLAQYYSEASNTPRELVLPIRTSLTPRDIAALARERVAGSISISVPARGKKRDLIKLGEENAKEYLEQSRASWEKAAESALNGLKKALKLKELPKRIEGYDISNIQGEFPVGSMAVFVDGTPVPSEYRKFKIKTVKGSNDFASLAEVLKRRFKNDGWPTPNLVLLDGGKGQLSTVLNALYSPSSNSGSPETAKGISGVVLEGDRGWSGKGMRPNQFIALAKREEEVFQGASLKKINIDPASSAGRLLQRIRDEAHRFGQKYYHARHAKAETKSILDDAPGIGPKTKKLLIQKFGSVSGIRNADKDDIIQLVGEAKTKTLLENL
ncbi:MAG: excinuclease ABC subunit UvrC [Parcubacteria group bacterium]|nr:excinuclease ABC subunit UvrC [Parcubacteria group bacterium]